MEESHPPNRNTWTIMCVRNTINFVMEMKTKFVAAAGCKRSSWNIKYLKFVTGFVWTLILCSTSSRVILLMFFWTNTVKNINSSYINKYVFDSHYIQIPNTHIFFSKCILNVFSNIYYTVSLQITFLNLFSYEVKALIFLWIKKLLVEVKMRETCRNWCVVNYGVIIDCQFVDTLIVSSCSQVLVKNKSHVWKVQTHSLPFIF